MSGYASTNYGPPPMGQSNLVNGLPATQQQQTPQGVAGALPPPFSASQQHIQQQQQQILQQKQPQQQQLLSQPVPTLQSNMSKYLPPTSNSASSAPNGPMRPLESSPTQAPAGNLPPHMRPSGMSGLPGGMPLTNGGGGSGDLSTNSSRTASPSLTHQAQFGGYNATTPMSHVPSGNVTPSNPKYAVASAASLSGSMQNLSINRTNGAAPANMPPSMTAQQHRQVSIAPNQAQQQQTPFLNNYQV